MTTNGPTNVSPNPAPSLTQAVNAAVGKSLPKPRGLETKNTKDLSLEYFHGLIYAETSAWKTTTAAHFGKPEDVRIILTRSEEQLKPIKDEGYQYTPIMKAADPAAAFLFAWQYPEQLWPDWAQRPNRTLVIDDLTKGIQILLDADDSKDIRKSYGNVADSVSPVFNTSLAKPQNLVLIALAKVKENPITDVERVGPDLPPSMLNSVFLPDLEFVFYIDPQTHKMRTDRDFITAKKIDEKGREVTYRREIFAKNKIELTGAGRGVIRPLEDPNLGVLWERVKAAGRLGAIK